MPSNRQKERINQTQTKGRVSRRFANSDKPKNIWTSLVRMSLFFKNRKGLIMFAMLLVIIESLCLMRAPMLIGKSIDILADYQNVARRNAFHHLLIILAAVYSVQFIAVWARRQIIARVSQQTIAEIRTSLFNKFSRRPIAYFDKHQYGDVMGRFTYDVQAVSATLSESISDLIALVLKLTIAFAMMLVISFQLTLVVIAILPFIYLLTRCVSKRARPLFREQASDIGKIFGMIEERLESVDVIRDFDQVERSVLDYQNLITHHKDISIKAMIITGFLIPMMNVLRNFTIALVALVGGVLAINYGMEIGMIVAFIGYERQFIRPLNQIAATYSALQSAIASAERIFDFLDLPPEQAFGQVDFKQQNDFTISFENVSFGYDKKIDVIKNISFEVKAGQKVALVGVTGAGKTTIAGLIGRFYRVDEGVIKIGQYSVDDYSTDSFYSKFGIVLQDSYLFKGTIEDNILYGRPDASREQLISAAQKARCHDFIMRLPDAYQTQLMAGAKRLSHGERQLITIARAIIAKPDILILDEATSNVDTKTEKEIQEALIELMKDRTSIIIAHRLSTIRDADLILVIDDGRVIAKGTHTSLMAQKSAYYDMVMEQFSD